MIVPQAKLYTHPLPFTLENGQTLHSLQIAYHTYGKPNPAQTNVVWVAHALTANADAESWWPGLVGIGCFFNPEEHFIVCANILGSCYGTTGPLSINPQTQEPYYHTFPTITVRDMVAAHQLLATHLGITQIEVLIGGSLGGQQAMEWAITAPTQIKNLVLLATNAYHSAWGIAYNQSQRLAIEADTTWAENSPTAGQRGLKAARAIALLSYRNYDTYRLTQTEDSVDVVTNFKAASYQNYQGDKLVNRFNAYTYYRLSQAMDSHNVGRGRGSVIKALQAIQANTIVIAISSDGLFPPTEQAFLAEHIPQATLHTIDSTYGHDGFLIETQAITHVLQQQLGALGNQY